jgi:hypothetical protein
MGVSGEIGSSGEGRTLLVSKLEGFGLLGVVEGEDMDSELDLFNIAWGEDNNNNDDGEEEGGGGEAGVLLEDEDDFRLGGNDLVRPPPPPPPPLAASWRRLRGAIGGVGETFFRLLATMGEALGDSCWPAVAAATLDAGVNSKVGNDLLPLLLREDDLRYSFGVIVGT